MKGGPRNRAKMHPGETKATRDEHQLVQSVFQKEGYKVIFSLADSKYAGTGKNFRGIIMKKRMPKSPRYSIAGYFSSPLSPLM